MKQVFLSLILLSAINLFAQTIPFAYMLRSQPYFFGGWLASSNMKSYPSSMKFQVFEGEDDPGKNSEPNADWECGYDVKQDSRFIGLNNLGIGFLNTSDPSSCHSIHAKVGAAVLALNTSNAFDIELSWTIRLIQKGDGRPTAREYKVAPQYKSGATGDWIDFPSNNVFSSSGKVQGSSSDYTVTLPTSCENQSLVQIRWKYYQEERNNGGSRPLIGLDDIGVRSNSVNYSKYLLFDNNKLNAFGCVQGTFSPIDSLTFWGENFTENIQLSTSGNYYFSKDKNSGYTQNMFITPEQGNVSKTKIYIKREGNTLGVENGSLQFISGSYTRNFSLDGETFPKLYINEVVSSNFRSLYDSKTKEYPDWIEVYNPNDSAISTAGWYWSDRVENLKGNKVNLSPGTRVPANGFTIFYAYGENITGTHLNFKLSSFGGETIFLTASDGRTIIDSLTLKKLDGDASYGRETDGDNPWVYFYKPTPLASNKDAIGYPGKSKPPVFSQKGGFYDESFLLKLSADNPNAKIYYTIDGSEPDPENLGGSVYEYKQSYAYTATEAPYIGKSYYRPYRTFLYFDPIDMDNFKAKYFWMGDINGEITKNSFIPEVKRPPGIIIRAVAVEPGLSISNVVTHTYFIGMDKETDQLPILSLSLSERDLKGFYTGIGVAGYGFESWRNSTTVNYHGQRAANFDKRGRDYEIPSNMEIYRNGLLEVNQEIGLRMHGATSRRYRVKSFNVYARSYYGKERIAYPFFPKLPYEDFSKLMLRGSGQDWNKTIFKDAFIQRLMNFSTVDYQEYSPFNIYVNGEYFGILNARERLNGEYIERKYGVDESQLDFIKINAAEIGSMTDYNDLMNYISTNDLSTDGAYQTLSKRIDFDNYIDYLSIKIYSAVNDWPHNNIIHWRVRTPYNPKAPFGLDGRWRWGNYDDDSGFDLSRVDSNSFLGALRFYTPNTPEGEEPTEWWATKLLRNLIVNPTFKLQLITRYSDLLNTAFLPNRVIGEVNYYQNLLQHDIKNHIDRWGLFERSGGIEGWNKEVEKLREFAQLRSNYNYQHMRVAFGLKNLRKVTLQVDDIVKGHIKINTIEIQKSTPGVDTTQIYPWTGQYFETLPVTLIPLPHDGYKFSHWEFPDSTSTIDTLQFELKRDVSIKAYFEIDDNYVYRPSAADIAVCPYDFKEWSWEQPEGVTPPHMAFYRTRFPDAKANDVLDGRLDSIRYDYSSKTRINGLGELGISFINTASANKNYYQTRLGAAAVAISTLNVPAAEVSFTLGTIFPQSKKYSIRLQYRFSDKGEVFDFKDKNGNLVEYKGSLDANDEKRFEHIDLPEEFLHRKYVQLIWRYFFNGEQINPSSDARDELRVDDITIRQKNIVAVKPIDEFSTLLIGNPNGVSYKWYRCQGDSLEAIPSGDKKDLKIEKPGNYALYVDYGDCAYISDCEYYYVKERKQFAPTIHTEIFPNPSDGNFDLIFDEVIDHATIELLNISGQLIERKVVKGLKEVHYKIQKLPAGIYFLNVRMEDGKKATRKVIIQ